MFLRNQEALKNDQTAILRQLSVPPFIAMYAKIMRMRDSRSLREKATLPDIYLGLAQEGAALVLAGELGSVVFSEPQKKPGATSVQIAFPMEFYDVLVTLKQSLVDGTMAPFGITLEGSGISLIGLTVRLMELAVKNRLGYDKQRSVKPDTFSGIDEQFLDV